MEYGTCKVCKNEFKQYQGRNRKICSSCNTKIRRQVNKIIAVNYLGGKCIRCGYDENPLALTFHHRESNEKEYSICRSINKS